MMICGIFVREFPIHSFSYLSFFFPLNQKNIMRVISFSRNVTKDYSFIEAVVELTKDTKMKSVHESLRLTFSFERGQVLLTQRKSKSKKCSDGNHERMLNNDFEYGTNLTYHIDLSRDYMQKERLIDIEVHARGKSPSIKTAEPMEEAMIEEYDENGKLVTNDQQDEEDQSPIDNDAPDQFAAFCDPDVLENFLKWSGLELDAQNAIFLLMTFPYYEHEWDLFGFLLECVFGCEEDESDDDIDDESMETIDQS